MATLLAGILCAILLAGLALALFTTLTAARIERGFAAPGRFIDIDGTRVHYLDEGDGPPVVILHGLNGQLRHFTHSLLDRLTPEFRVILIDRPGSGNSSLLAGGAQGIRAQGDLVARFIEALRLDRPLLVGHSLGGAVSLAVALDHPRRIRALALIAPLTQVETTVPPAFRALALPSPVLRWLFSRTLLIPMAIRSGRQTVAMVFGPETAPADFPTAGGGLLSLRPATYLAACNDLIGVEADLPGLVARYPTLTIPVAILYGKDDRILDWRKHGAAMREQVAALRLDVIDGGHMLPLTQPEATAAFIRSVAA